MFNKIYLIFVIILLSAYFYSCSREEIVNIPVITTQGVFVLYEGTFSEPGDYSFINLSNDSVSANVFQNSNNGATLGLFPDGMVLHLNQDLFIISQGNFGNPGKIFKINSTTNQLIDTAAFGANPYSFAIANNSIFAANLQGSSVTRLDLNLNITAASIPVGPNPSDVIFALANVYVAKTSYTSENSIAIVNVFNNSVMKAFFIAPPVSVANNIGGVYVSTFTNKKLYVLDSLVFNQIIDSIPMNISYDAIGDIVSGDSRTLYVVGLDTSAFGYTGKAVFKVDLVTRVVTTFIQDAQITDIYGISYEPFSNRIYIADSRGGTSNGQVRIYERSGVPVNPYPDIGGKFPKRFTFKYSN